MSSEDKLVEQKGIYIPGWFIKFLTGIWAIIGLVLPGLAFWMWNISSRMITIENKIDNFQTIYTETKVISDKLNIAEKNIIVLQFTAEDHKRRIGNLEKTP